GGQVEIQDVLVVPLAARSVDEALATTFDVYRAAAELSATRYGMRALTADEGGLAPPFATPEEMLALAVESIRRAGREPGTDGALAVDVASTHFPSNGQDRVGGRELDGAGMVALILDWIDRFPIVSVEDPLA